jgi:hypothetical protein
LLDEVQYQFCYFESFDLGDELKTDFCKVPPFKNSNPPSNVQGIPQTYQSNYERIESLRCHCPLNALGITVMKWLISLR